ncbi:MAG: hypothetical protein WCK98_03985 [bacterium]
MTSGFGTGLIFKGNFVEFCIFNIIFFLLGFITLGIFWIYLPYWSVKYFVANLEIEMYETENLEQPKEA